MMNTSQKSSQLSLMLTLGLIAVFLLMILVSQMPAYNTNSLTKSETVLAGAPEPTDIVAASATVKPSSSATAKTASPSASVKPFNIPTASASATALASPTTDPFTEVTDETPVPTFDLNLPGNTEPTSSPVAAKPAPKSNNTGLIIAAVVGTLLFLGGIAFLIISRRKESNEYTMPAPGGGSNPPAQPTSFMNSSPQPYDNTLQTGGGYSTPYDQYVNNPENQPNPQNPQNPQQGQ